MNQLTHIDLFAGIGGMSLAFEQHGSHCVFASETDKFAKKTYQVNHRVMTHGDITKIESVDIPSHDILLAGLPRQAFSIAGKKLGFEGKTKGTLFFEVARILRDKQPKAFLLENVKGLLTHDGGRTFDTIIDTLNDVGYYTRFKVVNSAGWVPQVRERVFIIGFMNLDAFSSFALPFTNRTTRLSDILHNSYETAEPPYTTYDSVLNGVYPVEKYTISDKLWAYLKRRKDEQKAKGNGFGYRMYGHSDISRTISARYGKDGSDCLIDQGPDRNPRKLTPRECARIMGYPDNFRIPVSDTQAYKQFGNSVVVPLVADIAKNMIKVIKEN